MRVVTVGTVQPQQLIYGPYPPGGAGTPTVVYNADEVNTLYLSNTQEIDAGCVAIPPLGAIPFDGSLDVWGLAINDDNESMSVYTIEGSTTPTPSPVQVQLALDAAGLATYDEQVNQETAIPGNIATTGVPLLTLSDPLIESVAETLAGGASATYDTITLTQIGYEINLSLQDNTGTSTTVPYISVDLAWYDSTTGVEVAHDTWYLLTGEEDSPNTVIGTGPTKGDELIITVKNLDPSVEQEIDITFIQNSRVYNSDVWLNTGTFTTSSTAFAVASPSPSSGQLAAGDPSLAADASVTYVLPLWNGVAQLGATIGAETVAWLIQTYTGTFPVAPEPVAGTHLGANDTYTQQFSMPRGNCLLSFANTSASGATSVGFVVSVQENSGGG
jgi:hypothetical protein